MEININGVKTNYKVFGNGEPFLILHGWGSSSERWATIAQALSENGFKVIVPDLPGFGESEPLRTAWNMNNYVRWIEEFVNELKIKEFYLAGHSFGGALSAKLTINHPQDVKKLFLVSAASVRKKTAKKTALKSISRAVKLFSWVPFYQLLRKAFYKFIVRHSDYPYVEGIMKETFKNVIFEDLSQFIGFIKVPTVIIWGDKDKATPVQDAYFMKNKIKGAKLEIIIGAGHVLNRECPEVLTVKILENV
jgi:pimeloyl-ACP methyl ester carboxylesterase